MFVFSLIGCASNVSQINEITIQKNKTKNLKSSVVQTETVPVNCGNYTVSIVGVTFNKSSGDVFKDVLNIGTGLKNSDDDSFSFGFDMGFMNSSDKEIANKNAYLCIYFKYAFNDKNTAQRDSVIPNMEITVIDDQGDAFSLIHNSIKDKYINVSYPYSVIIFKGFYDSKYAYININNTKYKLDLSIVK